MNSTAYELLACIRERQPLVHHLTNWVTIYDCAQVVKSLGASPVMAHAREEVTDMAQIASALVLNIGTLTIELVEAMKLAAEAAGQKGIPVILDVCGAGATPLRDQKVLELLDSRRVSIIKGNASEIARVAGARVKTKGVDASEVESDLEELARGLAIERKATVVVTGAQDLVTDGHRFFRVNNGHAIMTAVVGTGCMATSVIGTFAAVEPDLCVAATAALAVYGVAAEVAAQKEIGPSAFKQSLFDSLYSLDQETIEARQSIER